MTAAPAALADDVRLESQYAYFIEGAGGEGGSQVIVQTPSAGLAVEPAAGLEVHAGWEADIVTGATEEVADILTGATEFSDQRHAFTGGMRYEHEQTRIGAEGVWGRELDYRTKALSVSAEADVAERATTFSLGFAHNWDQVCNQANPEETDPTQRQWLDTSEGCFKGGEDRIVDPIAIDSMQAGWAQAWTPVLATQLVLSSQLIDGFQGNPYRAVRLAGAIAQEHLPDARARVSMTLRTNYFVRPLGGAIRLLLRAYRDTWDLESATGEIEYEQYIGSAFRVRGRGRYYRQTGAAFYSDDYRLEPRGEFFTGDRELSAFQSWVVGGRLALDLAADDEGEVLGFLENFEIMAKLDVIFYAYDEFTLAGQPVQDTRANVATIGLSAGF